MTSPILVTGGTGALGTHLIPRLRDAGRELRVLSRHSHESENGIEYVTGDLLKGEGVDQAVSGVEIVLHCAGSTKGDAEATRNLAQAAARAGVRHIIFISVIGADKVPLGWFKSKLGAEQAIIESGVPWTILRAAQFNDLVFTTVEKMAKLPIVPVPGGMRFQPVDSREVADRLVELTLGQPAGMVRELAGPKVYPMGDLVRDFLKAHGKRRMLMGMRMPGKAGKAYRAGDNLALEGNDAGKRTWEDFVAERVA